MVAAGHGDERASFTDVNIRWSFSVNTTAAIYLSFFDPTGPNNMLDNVSRLREPLLWVAGTTDRSQPGPGDAFSRGARQPAEPLCHGPRGASRKPQRRPRSRAYLAERTAIVVPTRALRLAGERASLRFLEFFGSMSPIRGHAGLGRGGGGISGLVRGRRRAADRRRPVGQVATRIETGTRELAAPSVKQLLAALCQLFDR